MSKTLQSENQEKEQLIQKLQLEKEHLGRDIAYLQDANQNTDMEIEAIQKVKIKSLTDEIAYLKKHYVGEIEHLKQEN